MPLDLASGVLGDLPGNSVHTAECLAGGKAEAAVKRQGELQRGVTAQTGLLEGGGFFFKEVEHFPQRHKASLNHFYDL